MGVWTVGSRILCEELLKQEPAKFWQLQAQHTTTELSRYPYDV